MANNRIPVIRLTTQSHSESMACYGACLKWMLPELSFSDRWSRGTYGNACYAGCLLMCKATVSNYFTGLEH